MSKSTARQAALLPSIGRRPQRKPSLSEGRTSMPWVHWPTVASATAALVVLAIGWPLMLLGVLAALVYVFSGARHAVQALFVMVTVKYLNAAAYDFPPFFGIVAWLVLFAAAARILWAGIGTHSASVHLAIWVFVLIVAALTPASSGNAAISWFKLFSFAVGATAVVAAAMSLRSEDAGVIRVWFPSVALAVAIVSLLVAPFPGISQNKVPGSFQGILGHPQTFGAFMAPLLALMIGRLLFYRQKFKVLDWACLGLVLVLTFASGTRTAVIAVFLGILSAMFMGVWRDRHARRQALRSWSIGLGVSAMALIAALSIGPVRSATLEFVFKRGHGDSVEEAFMASRGVGIEAQWQSFLDRPIIGNGFGVYPGGFLPGKPVMFMGLPISAPVEKGFLPTAVLEEVGLAGTIPFVVLIVLMVRRTFRTGDQVWLGVTMTCLFVNIGEAVFFSMGGLGLLFWLWIAVAMRGTAPQTNVRRGPAAMKH